MEIVKVKEKGRTFYKDPKKGITYKQFLGGFAWPGVLPGFICVVGEEHDAENLHVVYEKHYENLDELAKNLLTLESLYYFKDLDRGEVWLADKEGTAKQFESLLDDITRILQDRILLIIQPDLAKDLRLALQVLRREFNQNTLKISHGGILHGKIEQLDKADLSDPGLIDNHPEIMTLASIIFDFDMLSERINKNRPKDKWEDAFNQEPKSSSWMAT